MTSSCVRTTEVTAEVAIMLMQDDCDLPPFSKLGKRVSLQRIAKTTAVKPIAEFYINPDGEKEDIITFTDARVSGKIPGLIKMAAIQD